MYVVLRIFAREGKQPLAGFNLCSVLLMNILAGQPFTRRDRASSTVQLWQENGAIGVKRLLIVLRLREE